MQYLNKSFNIILIFYILILIIKNTKMEVEQKDDLDSNSTQIISQGAEAVCFKLFIFSESLYYLFTWKKVYCKRKICKIIQSP